jgi:site-specific recombinase XerD
MQSTISRRAANLASEPQSASGKHRPHWLRHTVGSHMMDDQVDLRFVRDNLGHASISTTSQYLHADDDDRHRATESGLKLNW